MKNSFICSLVGKKTTESCCVLLCWWKNPLESWDFTVAYQRGFLLFLTFYWIVYMLLVEVI